MRLPIQLRSGDAFRQMLQDGYPNSDGYKQMLEDTREEDERVLNRAQFGQGQERPSN